MSQEHLSKWRQQFVKNTILFKFLRHACGLYLSNNVWRDFRLPISVSVYLAFKLFRATFANDTRSLIKSLHTLFDTYLDHIPEKLNKIIFLTTC